MIQMTKKKKPTTTSAPLFQVFQVGTIIGATFLEKSWRIDMNSNYDVIQGDCPNCPFADLFGGFCFYYRFYPVNIGYGEATCRCEKLKPNED